MSGTVGGASEKVGHMTITEFLLARIAERESDVARRGTMAVGHSEACIYEGGYEGTTNCDCGAVARVLAECEAKRRIVAAYVAWDEADGGQYSPAYWEAPMTEVLAALALPFADHPDFDEAWRA